MIIIIISSRNIMIQVHNVFIITTPAQIIIGMIIFIISRNIMITIYNHHHHHQYLCSGTFIMVIIAKSGGLSLAILTAR